MRSRYDGGIPSMPIAPMTRLRPVRSFALVAALLGAGSVHADGLADLRAALARLQAQTPVKATLDVKTMERRGEGADALEKLGQASVTLEEGARGLQVVYAKDTLAQVDAESRRLILDSKAKTPTVWALASLDSTEAMAMASAAQALSRRLDESVFRSETADTLGGKPARLLSFTVPLKALPEQQRKYVKEFDATLAVWIAADGTPLASTVHASVKGRAFVVISFEAIDDTRTTYGVLGDRLLTLHTENHSTSSGAGEHGEMRVVRTLTPQTPG
jgi:hypothetical protein